MQASVVMVADQKNFVQGVDVYGRAVGITQVRKHFTKLSNPHDLMLFTCYTIDALVSCYLSVKLSHGSVPSACSAARELGASTSMCLSINCYCPSTVWRSLSWRVSLLSSCCSSGVSRNCLPCSVRLWQGMYHTAERHKVGLAQPVGCLWCHRLLSVIEPKTPGVASPPCLISRSVAWPTWTFGA